jgi:hypothetical protein
MTEALIRISASPYARRLAKMRSIPLGLLAGTGPTGRIVAADVLAFTPVSDAVPLEQVAPRSEVRPLESRTQPASARSAFSTAISTGALNALIASAGTAGFPLDLEDIALRAASHALAIAGLPGTSAIAFESGARRIIVDADLRLSVGHHRKARLAALEGTSEEPDGKALLSLQVVGTTRVTSLLISLPPGQAMRLRLSKDAEAEGFSALLCTDPEALPDEMAVAFLSAFSDALEQPLALLA